MDLDDQNRCYHYLTHDPLVNRWAAFTLEEVFLLLAWSDYFDASRRRPEIQADDERMKAELNAELGRRKRAENLGR